jgi:LytS/YehU family sensor histidine kinase
VENAIRHGFAKRAEASTISIGARVDGATLELTIADDGLGFDASRPAPGVGLTNTRERLRVLYGSRAALEISSAPGRGTRAVVRIPFRTQIHV